MKTSALFAMFALFAATSFGQVFEVGGFGGALRLSNSGKIGSADFANPSNPDAQVTLQNKWLFGGRMTMNQWDHFGWEIAQAYHRTSLQIGPDSSTAIGTAIHTTTGGFVAYATPEGTRIRPFAQGGGGYSVFIPPGGSISRTGGDRKWGFFFGGGIKYRLSEDRPWMIRFDWRQHYTGKPFDLPGQSGLLGRSEISLGISYVL